MLLTAEDTYGVRIEVYDANGNHHDTVFWCDTDTGTICSAYKFCPPIRREYIAPAPLKLINKETGVQITDELDLAVCAAFKRARQADEHKWERLKERQDRAFLEMRVGIDPLVVRVNGLKPGNYIYDAFRKEVMAEWVDDADRSRYRIGL